MVPSADRRAWSARAEILALALLWAAATAFNVTKAVHIDDTAYLEIARAIRHDPLHAMRAELNWVHEREPIHAVNQPHLFFYFLALSMGLFGDNEVAFHMVEAAFTFLALTFFHLLAKADSGASRRRVAVYSVGPVRAWAGAVCRGRTSCATCRCSPAGSVSLWALLTPRPGRTC